MKMQKAFNWSQQDSRTFWMETGAFIFDRFKAVRVREISMTSIFIAIWHLKT